MPPSSWLLTMHIIGAKASLTYYIAVIMSSMASQINGVSIDYSVVCSSVDQRKHQSSASLAFVWGIHRWPVNSPYKGPVTRKRFPFDDVVMNHTDVTVTTDNKRILRHMYIALQPLDKLCTREVGSFVIVGLIFSRQWRDMGSTQCMYWPDSSS